MERLTSKPHLMDSDPGWGDLLTREAQTSTLHIDSLGFHFDPLMISVCLLSETTVVSVVSNGRRAVAVEIGGPSAERDTPDSRHVPVARSRVFQMLHSSPSCQLQLLLNTSILVWIRWSGQDSGKIPRSWSFCSSSPTYSIGSMQTCNCHLQ